MSRKRDGKAAKDTPARALVGGIFCVLLFGAAGAAGLAVFWQVTADSFRALGWERVPAVVTEAGLDTHLTRRGGRTHEAWGAFRYTYGGKEYTSERIGANRLEGADNFGSWQEQVAKRLRQAERSGSPVLVHVNPQDPAEAIFDPSFRWGLGTAVGVLAAGGLGVGLLGILLIVSAIREWSASSSKRNARRTA